MEEIGGTTAWEKIPWKVHTVVPKECTEPDIGNSMAVWGQYELCCDLFIHTFLSTWSVLASLLRQQEYEGGQELSQEWMWPQITEREHGL